MKELSCIIPNKRFNAELREIWEQNIEAQCYCENSHYIIFIYPNYCEWVYRDDPTEINQFDSCDKYDDIEELIKKELEDDFLPLLPFDWTVFTWWDDEKWKHISYEKYFEWKSQKEKVKNERCYMR